MITVHRDLEGNVVPPPPPPPQNMYPTLNGIEADPANFHDVVEDGGDDDSFHEVQEDGAAGGQEPPRNPPADAVPTAPHFVTQPQPHWIEMACRDGDLKAVKADDLVAHAKRLGIPNMVPKQTKRETAEAAVVAFYLAHPRQ